MNRKTQSHHISQTSFTSSLDISRRIAIRRRLIESKRTNQSQDLNNTQNISSNIRNTVSNISRAIIKDENNSLISNQTNINNTYINSSPSVKKKIGKRENSLYLSEKIVLNKIEENKPIEQNINSEIKDTVKCYICHNIITKPKMCQFCHRIACEKCLYNWFIIEQKQNCAYCHEKANFCDMISVPFMSTIADFVEKVFEKEEKEEEISDDNNKGFCPDHIKEQMHYYCLNCNRGYCKICFVFFGKEKDKHVNHNIIKYDQYKNYQIDNLKKYEDKFEQKILEINEKIKLCESYKESYEFERKKGNEFLENLKIEFNRQINDNIRLINNYIKSLRNFLSKYKKSKSDIHDIYSKFSNKKSDKEISNNFFNSQKIVYESINKFSSMISEKIYTKKDIEELIELSKEIHVNTYQTKLYEINNDNILCTNNIKLGNSPFLLKINNEQNKNMIINLLIPKDKIIIRHNFTSFIFIKKKDNEVKSFELKDINEDNNFIYLKNSITWDFFGQSSFKIKGILYDFYFV